VEQTNVLFGRLSRVDVLIGGRGGTDECFDWTVEQGRCSYWRAETKTSRLSSDWMAERHRRMF
jgi:hypothetical protein